jgi:hypothetical protein
MISNSLKNIYRDIHKNTPFGKRAKVPPYLDEFIKIKQPNSVLDFGCGKGNLVKVLNELYPNKKIIGYDPANPEYDIPLPDVDMIISTDVLEHVEPEHIKTVLETLCIKSPLQYHLISCAPAKLILPDGRNAHLIQETPEWWRNKFTQAGVRVIKEDYKEFSKYSKQLRKEIPVKNFFIMAERI